MDRIMEELVPEEEVLHSEHVRNLFFGNYMEPDSDVKTYDQVNLISQLDLYPLSFFLHFLFILFIWYSCSYTMCNLKVLDLDDLTEKMEYYLNDYNMLSRTQMNLVMFKFAIEHISRVSRVLMQDNGNCLLVGIGGSGRHSAAKMAASMAEYSIFEIELSRNYGPSEWREDLKSLLLKVGIEAKPLVFLFSDTQIADEMFTEDINMVLNTGDVPNLFQTDEKVEILEKMQTAARESVSVIVSWNKQY